MRILPMTAACLALAGCGGGASAGPKAPRIPLAGDTGAASAAQVPSAARGLRLSRIGTFSAPTYVTSPPGDARRLFVVEQGGTIWELRDRRLVRRPFLDLRSDVQAGGERGLLSMAFAPDYARSRRFYVYFTGQDGDVHVQEFRTLAGHPDRADRGSRRELLRLEHSEFPNHNGGQLQFGPDGLLYAGFGDGGGAGDPHGNGQNLGTLYGKIIRIDPARSGGRPYAIPVGNPFRRRGGARPEIYDYGLRNPWRFSFDRATGDMVIADVGQDRIEEVDFAKRSAAAGRNYGWSAFEALLQRPRPRRGTSRHPALPLAGLVLDHGRLRGSRPLAGPALRALRLRRLLRRRAALGAAERRPRPGRQPDRVERPAALVIR
jgi:glucose/arabinose dehydrogenase